MKLVKEYFTVEDCCLNPVGQEVQLNFPEIIFVEFLNLVMVFYILSDKNANKELVHPDFQDENPRPGEETFHCLFVI
jgi:hypothetical protein